MWFSLCGWGKWVALVALIGLVLTCRLTDSLNRSFRRIGSLTIVGAVQRSRNPALESVVVIAPTDSHSPTAPRAARILADMGIDVCLVEYAPQGEVEVVQAWGKISALANRGAAPHRRPLFVILSDQLFRAIRTSTDSLGQLDDLVLITEETPSRPEADGCTILRVEELRAVANVRDGERNRNAGRYIVEVPPSLHGSLIPITCLAAYFIPTTSQPEKTEGTRSSASLYLLITGLFLSGTSLELCKRVSHAKVLPAPWRQGITRFGVFVSSIPLTTGLCLVLSGKMSAPATQLEAWVATLRDPQVATDYEYLRSTCDSRQDSSVLREHAWISRRQRRRRQAPMADDVYREYVLNPDLRLPGQLIGQWRIPLWLAIGSCFRTETDNFAVAQVIWQRLSERIRVTLNGNDTDPVTTWEKGVGTPKAFARTCLAAFRSAGVPARLLGNDEVEVLDGDRWTKLPRPFVIVPREEPNGSGGSGRS